MDFVWNPISRTIQYTNQSISKHSSHEHELADCMDQSISDGVQNLWKIIILLEESCGDFEWNPIPRTMQYTNHSISRRISYESELSNFVDQSISDWFQNFGNIIIWWEESIGGFSVKSNILNYAIHQPLHFITNFAWAWIIQFHGPIDIRLITKLGEHDNMVGGVNWWVLSEIQYLEL